MASIRRLSSHEASRPRCDRALPRLASIVEELVLNALDAEATDVRVALDISTCTVSVRDNGVGIGKESLRVVGERCAGCLGRIGLGIQARPCGEYQSGGGQGVRCGLLNALNAVNNLTVR